MVPRTARGEKYLHYVALGYYKPTGKNKLHLLPAEMLERKRMQWREASRRHYYKRKLAKQQNTSLYVHRDVLTGSTQCSHLYNGLR